MIVINVDKDNLTPRNYKKIDGENRGRLINNIFIIDDVVDNSRDIVFLANRRKLLCKCMRCGRIFLVGYRHYKEYGLYCKCQKAKPNSYRCQREEFLDTMRKEIKLVKDEAILEEDFKRLEDLKKVYDFIRSQDLLQCYFVDKPIDKDKKT